MERRHVIGGGLAAGMTGLLSSPGAAAAEAQRNGDGNDELVAGAINDLRRALERQFDACELGPCPTIAAIRSQQRTFLRSTQKYPDFIEVGLDIWDRVYDWHVKYQRPITAGRLPDGRYAMTFMFTNLLLRPEQSPQYVGFGFDGDTAPLAPPAPGR